METFVITTFGVLAEKMGDTSISVPYQRDTECLLKQLFKQYPILNTSSFFLAIDKKIVQENTSLTGKEEIALLPPFSGG